MARLPSTVSKREAKASKCAVQRHSKPPVSYAGVSPLRGEVERDRDLAAPARRSASSALPSLRSTVTCGSSVKFEPPTQVKKVPSKRSTSAGWAAPPGVPPSSGSSASYAAIAASPPVPERQRPARSLSARSTGTLSAPNSAGSSVASFAPASTRPMFTRRLAM